MCVNNLSKVALDSAATGIEPAISSRKSNALTTFIRHRAAPPIAGNIHIPTLEDVREQTIADSWCVHRAVA